MMPRPALPRIAFSRRHLAPLLVGLGLATRAPAGEPSQGSNRNEEESFGRVDLHTPRRRLVPRSLVIIAAGKTQVLDLRTGLPRYREDRLDLVDLSRLPLIGGLLRAPLTARFAGALPVGTLHLTRNALVLRADDRLPPPRRIVIAHREISWETRRAPQPADGPAPATASAPVGTAYRQPDSNEWLLVVAPAIFVAPV